MQYNESMARREALIVEANGERFRFYYDLDQPQLLHVTLRHGTTPPDAIEVFFESQTGPRDDAHARYETLTETHGIYWARHAGDHSVIIISCFKREDE